MVNEDMRTFRQARTAKVLKTVPRWRTALAIGFVIVVVVVPCFFLMQEMYGRDGNVLPGVLIVIGSILLSLFPILCPWFFRTLRYVLGPDALTIVRVWPLSRIRVPCDGITSVTRPVLEHQYGSLEAGGNPMLAVSRSPFVRMVANDSFIVVQMGLFDYRVACPRVKVFGAVTDPRNLVLIEGNCNFLLSPENPDEFVECLRRAWFADGQLGEV